jgi:hypothetical protein
VCDADTLADLLEITVEDILERFPERIRTYRDQLCDYCDSYFPESMGSYFEDAAEAVEEYEEEYYYDED